MDRPVVSGSAELGLREKFGVALRIRAVALATLANGRPVPPRRCTHESNLPIGPTTVVSHGRGTRKRPSWHFRNGMVAVAAAVRRRVTVLVMAAVVVLSVLAAAVSSAWLATVEPVGLAEAEEIAAMALRDAWAAHLPIPPLTVLIEEETTAAEVMLRWTCLRQQRSHLS